MATRSSTLAWRIPGTVEPGGLQPMGSQRVGYDWATKQFPPERQYKRALDLGSDRGPHYPVCPGSVSLCFHRTSASSPEFPGVSVTVTKQWGVSGTAGLPVESSPTLRAQGWVSAKVFLYWSRTPHLGRSRTGFLIATVSVTSRMVFSVLVKISTPYSIHLQSLWSSTDTSEVEGWDISTPTVYVI